jgi:3D (Asp-Asp-Asp) domain-containing protein
MPARAPVVALSLVLLAGLPGCALFRRPSAPPVPPAPPRANELDVTATAYNSLPDQTGPGDPRLTASGTTLEPGMRVVAVSDDLYEMGLRFGTRVWIEGMPGEWRVEDRMASRWRRRIDVYMGNDRPAAERFGERRVRIRWQAPR